MNIEIIIREVLVDQVVTVIWSDDSLPHDVTGRLTKHTTREGHTYLRVRDMETEHGEKRFDFLQVSLLQVFGNGNAVLVLYY